MHGAWRFTHCAYKDITGMAIVYSVYLRRPGLISFEMYNDEMGGE